MPARLWWRGFWQHRFHPKSFDLQVRSVWGVLDKLLVEMRDHDEPRDEHKYGELLESMHVIPEGGNPLDYGY